MIEVIIFGAVVALFLTFFAIRKRMIGWKKGWAVFIEIAVFMGVMLYAMLR